MEYLLLKIRLKWCCWVQQQVSNKQRYTTANAFFTLFSLLVSVLRTGKQAIKGNEPRGESSSKAISPNKATTALPLAAEIFMSSICHKVRHYQRFVWKGPADWAAPVTKYYSVSFRYRFANKTEICANPDEPFSCFANFFFSDDTPWTTVLVGKWMDGSGSGDCVEPTIIITRYSNFYLKMSFAVSVLVHQRFLIALASHPFLPTLIKTVHFVQFVIHALPLGRMTAQGERDTRLHRLGLATTPDVPWRPVTKLLSA